VQVTSGKHGEFASTLYATASVLNAVEDVERDLKWLIDASQTVPMFQQVPTQIPFPPPAPAVRSRDLSVFTFTSHIAVIL
jgi:hypothetical protein